jgi:hypothetical protein
MAVEHNVLIDPGAAAVPSFYVNKFQVSVSGVGVRIAFAEEIGGIGPNYRTSVTLSLGDAMKLAELLAQLIGQIIQPSPQPKTE